MMRGYKVVWLWLSCWVFIGKSITISSPCVSSRQSVSCRSMGMSWSLQSCRSKPLEGLGKRENSLKANTMLKCGYFCQDFLPRDPCPHHISLTPSLTPLPGAPSQELADTGAQDSGALAQAPDQQHQRAPISVQFHAWDTPRGLEIHGCVHGQPGLSPAWEYKRENFYLIATVAIKDGNTD